MIQDEAFRCKDITERLLDFSRIGDVKRHTADLRELVQGVIEMVGHLGKYNEKHHHFGERTPLTAAISSDNGKSWRIIGNIAADPKAEYTNLDCLFTSKGNAVLTYMYAKPAWNRKQISLKAALIQKEWFGKK